MALDTVKFGKVAVNYEGDSAGGWLHLEGFEVKLPGDGTYDAHITITKPLTGDVNSDIWHLCHFTVNKATTNHVFYEVQDDGAFTTTGNVLDREGKNRQAKSHFSKKDWINDKTLERAIEHEVLLIFRHLAR